MLINLFQSVSWIRTYLKYWWNVNFQTTVKLKDKATDMMINPYSIKFEVFACHRASFETEKKAILAIKSLSHHLLVEYQSNHRKCEISDTSCSLVSKSVSIQHESHSLPTKIINHMIIFVGKKHTRTSGKVPKKIEIKKHFVSRVFDKVWNLEIVTSTPFLLTLPTSRFLLPRMFNLKWCSEPRRLNNALYLQSNAQLVISWQ